MYNLTSILMDAWNEHNIEVFYVPEEDNTAKNKEGIHLLNPKQYELERAIEDAANKGFKMIYIHMQF